MLRRHTPETIDETSEPPHRTRCGTATTEQHNRSKRFIAADLASPDPGVNSNPNNIQSPNPGSGQPALIHPPTVSDGDRHYVRRRVISDDGFVVVKRQMVCA